MILAQAFQEACQHGTHPSYRARIKVIGHSGAGKTSLTRRLLGQKFQEKEESTDGIETHRIEFDLYESPDSLNSWVEADLKPEKLAAHFSREVFQRKKVISVQHDASMTHVVDEEIYPNQYND